jgi:N,N-dimethylformamidase
MRPEFLAWMTGCPRHFAADLLLLEWLEREGVAYEVLTDEDLHREGRSALDPYRVVLTGGHPEYWTSPMLDGLEAYLAAGGRLMYLGGNGFYWVTGIAEDAPHLIEVRRGINGTRSWTSHPGETTLTTTGEPGGLWRYRGRPPNALVGVGFASEGWGGAPGYTRLPDARDSRAAWVFDGVEEGVIGDFGLVMGGAAGDEIDRYDLALGTPPETLRLATSEGRHSDCYQLVIEDMGLMLAGRGGTEDPRVRADLTLLESSDGGAVFSTGSINWVGSLLTNGGDNNVSRITRNVLRRFAGLD